MSLFLTTGLLGALNNGGAKAEGGLARQTGYFQDISTIKLKDKTYTDKVLDDSHDFYSNNDTDGCPDKIYDISDFNDKTAKWLIISKGPYGDCVESKSAFEVDLKNTTSHANLIALKWADAYKIQRMYSSKNEETYTYDKKEGLYYQNESGGDGCLDTIKPIKQPKPSDKLSLDYADYTQAVMVVREELRFLNDDGGSLATKALRDNYKYYPFHDDIEYSGHGKSGGSTVDCQISKPFTVYIGATDKSHDFNGTKPTNGDRPTGTNSTSKDKRKDDPNNADCQIQGALGWVLNPICDVAVQSTKNLGDYVTRNLRVEPLTQTQGKDAGGISGIYEAWKVFRDFANALLILVFLIAIFAQVLPIEIDAYTVKKTLPKLIAAAIAIQLSYFMCQVMVDISNVLGGGVDTLVRSVISQVPPIPKSGSSTNFASFMFVGIAGLTIAAAFIGPVVMLLIAGIISIITMLVTIQARQVILIFLAIASPLAILAWTLPNTEQYAKKWGQNYIKLLLMYPLIAFILAGSELVYIIMSSALGTSTDTTALSSVQQVMINFIPVIAFFMIPATFKASGAITGAIANAGFGRTKRLSSRAVSSAGKRSKEFADERGAKLLGSERRIGRFTGRALTGTMLTFGAKGERKRNALSGAVKAQEAKDANEFLDNNAHDNAQLADQALNKGNTKAVKQQALSKLMANGGWKEYSEIYKQVKGDKGQFDAKKAKDVFGLGSEAEASELWRRAHEGSNGGAAVGKGFRSADGYAGVDDADGAAFSSFRKEALTDWMDRKSTVADHGEVIDRLGQIASNKDMRDKLPPAIMKSLKKPGTGTPEEQAAAAKFLAQARASKKEITFTDSKGEVQKKQIDDFLANYINDSGQMVV